MFLLNHPALLRRFSRLASLGMKSSAIVVTAFAISGCNAQAVSEAELSYPALYQSLSETHDKVGSKHTDSRLTEREKFADFIQAHADLKAPGMAESIRSAYAEEIYFNDTLQTHTSRDSLIEYLSETAERVDYNRVQIQAIIPSGEDYYVKWTMQTGFTVFGKSIETESIGMTHIRLDQQGKINFHQDFWDNTEGFFRHLPVVGYLIGKTKQRL